MPDYPPEPRIPRGHSDDDAYLGIPPDTGQSERKPKPDPPLWAKIVGSIGLLCLFVFFIVPLCIILVRGLNIVVQSLWDAALS